jgi:hypothetical protein
MGGGEGKGTMGRVAWHEGCEHGEGVYGCEETKRPLPLPLPPPLSVKTLLGLKMLDVSLS